MKSEPSSSSAIRLTYVGLLERGFCSSFRGHARLPGVVHSSIEPIIVHFTDMLDPHVVFDGVELGEIDSGVIIERLPGFELDLDRMLVQSLVMQGARWVRTTKSDRMVLCIRTVHRTLLPIASNRPKSSGKDIMRSDE